MRYRLRESVLLEYSKNSVQFDLPPDAAREVLRIAALIPDEHLMGKGRETRPHLTLRYGVSDQAARALRGNLRFRPFHVSLGEVMAFPPSKHSDGAVPLYLEVTGYTGKLRDLRDRVVALAGEGEENFSSWTPHVTLAYVRPEVAYLYVGRDQFDYAGPLPIIVDRVTVSNRENHPTSPDGVEVISLC